MHIPVLLKETVEILDPNPGEFFIDGTVGGGGHAAMILKRMGLEGRYMAIDLNESSLLRTKRLIKEKMQLPRDRLETYWIRDNFKNLPNILKELDLNKADGLILDLGFSSMELESGRGFSFKKDEPLIMRYDEDISGLTAARVLSEFDGKRLSEILKKYGEERFADRIASEITKSRREKPIRTTFDLAEVIKRALPSNYNPKSHPALRTFLALRSFINQELKSLESVLDNILKIIKEGGRAAVISFNSLEDRIIKEKFQELISNDEAEVITEDPIMPSEEEIKINPKSRSAKLRGIRIKGQ